MELYFELQKTPVFTIDDVNLLYGNIESARSAVKRLVAKGLVEKIRNNIKLNNNFKKIKIIRNK